MTSVPIKTRVPALVGVLSTTVALTAASLYSSPLAPFLRRFGGVTLAAAAVGLAIAAWRAGPLRGARSSTALGRLCRAGWLAVAGIAPVLVGFALLPPCATEEVVFGDGEVRLAGTLYLPDGAGPHPAAVIVHGSTRQTRDSFLGLYRAVAEGLAVRGVAALVYDKRGCGASGGDFRSALMPELAADAAAGVRWLTRRSDIDARRVGLWGLSQGGWVAPLAAATEPAARFVVVVSAPSTSEGEQRLFEWTQRLRGEGAPADHIAALCDLQRLIWDYYRTGEGWIRVQAAWRDAREQPWWPWAEGLERPGPAPPDQVASAAGQRSLRWHRTDMARDPLAVLADLQVPVLAMYGGEDDVIPARQSRDDVAAAVARTGNAHARVVWYPEATHPMIVARIPPTFPPGYFDTLASWIASVTPP